MIAGLRADFLTWDLEYKAEVQTIQPLRPIIKHVGSDIEINYTLRSPET
jgi:hypothetical protein